MILQRFYDDRLAQASYLIGCKQAGEAIVIDANRDVEPYLAAARAERVRITHVTETHIHADFVSGTRELAARTGATVWLSAEGGPDWQYGFQDDANVQLLHDGDRFEVGSIVVDVEHTPGHTPEHLIFFITDGQSADMPIGVVSGDFVFVGDVGRPDLLEKAANVRGSMAASARTLYASLQHFKNQPDYLQIWPGHGAGSACGKSLSATPHTTVGYERLFNWAFASANEDEFVRNVLADQPEPPRYFAEMKRINRIGPRVLNGFSKAPVLDADRLSSVLDDGSPIVDTRLPHQFARKHVPRTINIPLDRSFSTWAGGLLPYDRDIFLIVDSKQPTALDDAIKALAMIGLDRIGGYWTDGVFAEWTKAGGKLARVEPVKPVELAELISQNATHVLDVRNRSEFAGGHLPGARNIPLAELQDRLGELSGNGQLVVHCQSGTRSAIAASILQAHGFAGVRDLMGGFGDWKRSGLPEAEAEAEAEANARAKTGATVNKKAKKKSGAAVKPKGIAKSKERKPTSRR
jgi:hydroxyacylglutathione hydrolase